MSVDFARRVMSDGDYALFVDLQEIGEDLKHRISLSQEMISDGISSESLQALNTY